MKDGKSVESEEESLEVLQELTTKFDKERLSLFKGLGVIDY